MRRQLLTHPDHLRPRAPATGVTAAPPLSIERHHGDGLPIYRQVYGALRQAIQTGKLRQGDRLPSTRALASELGVSRTSILLAFDELRAEGLVVGKVGSGTRIAKVPGSSAVRHRTSRATSDWNPHDEVNLPGTTRSFRIGLPALDLFPSVLWGQLASRRWKAASSSILDYSDAAGYLPLRQTIAEYLGRTRGIVCSSEQVFIVSGSQQGLDLVARTMTGPRDVVWLEDPGYHGAYEAFASTGATTVPIPVDAQGFQLSQAQLVSPGARLAYVTPSSQFPLSCRLSAERRQELLDWTADEEGWIVEDDYDCEFTPLHEQLPALAAAPGGDRVIYVATFSKTVFPALRLGYMVIPLSLVDRFRAQRHVIDRQSSTIHQAIMTDFIYEGHYDRHLRRMRRIYLHRGEMLRRLLESQIGDLLEVTNSSSGLHLVAWLPPHVSDVDASRAAAHHNLEALPLSFFARQPLARGALVLGFGGIKEEEMPEAVDRLRLALIGRVVRSA
jgi:GntR family transcriptional regulator / MocR family aminotransferase